LKTASSKGAPSIAQTVASSGYSLPQYEHFFIGRVCDYGLTPSGSAVGGLVSDNIPPSSAPPAKQ
jgi:hypothetical protein